MEVTFESLTETIKRAETAREVTPGQGKFYWNGYINALKDLRNSINSKD